MIVSGPAAVSARASALVAIESTRTACAGAAAAYALRCVSGRAGAYAPGIDERLFFELSRDECGRDLARAAAWFADRGATLSRLGYRVGVRLVAFPTDALLAWVAAGGGYRASVLGVACQPLHPEDLASEVSSVTLICMPGSRINLTHRGPVAETAPERPVPPLPGPCPSEPALTTLPGYCYRLDGTTPARQILAPPPRPG